MTLPTRRPVRMRALLAPACAAALLAAPAPSPLVAPSAAQEAASAVQDLVLDNVTLSFGETSVSAPRVAVSGTRLSKEELLAIFQGDAKESWGTRLQRLDAGSLTMPELRVERRGDKRQIVTYRDVTARNVHGGRISELTAAGATLSVEGAAGQPAKASGSYGKIRAEEVDLTALARLYAEAGTARSGFQRLYASLAVEAIAFIDERGTTVSIARLTGRDLAGRQTPATWSGAVESLAGADLSQPDPGKRARAAGLIADLAESVSVGSLEASEIAVKEMKGPDPLNFAIGKFAYTGNGAEAGVSLADLSFGSAEARGKVGRLGLTGFSLEPTIATLRRLAKGAPDKGAPDKPADPKPGEKAAPVPPPADPAAQEAELRRLTPVIGTLTLSDLTLDVAGHGQDPAAKAAPMPIGVRGGIITFGPPKDGVPTASRLSLTGLTLPASAVESVPGLGSLGLYGYRDLDLDVIADTAWNEGTKELSFNELSLTGKDMGRLRLNATLGGIGPDVFDPDAAVSGFAMLSATAKALDLTLENGGLFDRFITAQAKTLSLKPDELRKEYVTASVIGVPVILGNSAAAKAIGAAMGKFVSKPGTLSISAKAKNGDGLGMVDVSTAPTPAAVLDKLEVNAKAE